MHSLSSCPVARRPADAFAAELMSLVWSSASRGGARSRTTCTRVRQPYNASLSDLVALPLLLRELGSEFGGDVPEPRRISRGEIRQDRERRAWATCCIRMRVVQQIGRGGARLSPFRSSSTTTR